MRMRIYNFANAHTRFLHARARRMGLACSVVAVYGAIGGEALSISTKDASQDVFSQRFWDGARVRVEPRLRHAVDPVSSFSPRSHG